VVAEGDGDGVEEPSANQGLGGVIWEKLDIILKLRNVSEEVGDWILGCPIYHTKITEPFGYYIEWVFGSIN
jgi:hypothetical protein